MESNANPLWPGYVMSTKVIFRRAEVFVLAEVYFRDVRMQSCLAHRFLVKRENGGARGQLMNIYFLHADVSEDRLPLEQRLPLV